MTPSTAYPSAVVVAVDYSSMDSMLARKAASSLVRTHPRKTPEQISEALFEQLRQERLRRESQGLNHWEEYAPKFLDRVVRQAQTVRLRQRREAAAFYKTKHREVMRFAQSIVKDSAAAEQVASDTYRELAEGRTTVPNFFVALVGNSRNHLESRAYRQAKFVSLEEVFSPSDLGSEGATEDDGEGLSLEPVSHRFEDQDPLDILIAREDQAEKERQIHRATRIAQEDWRYCWIGQKKWGRELGIATTRVRKS